MPLEVPCPCGNTLTVSEAKAGGEVYCRCGRTLTAPSIRARPSPEQAFESLAAAGRLPLEAHCVSCGAATDHTVHCRMECEKAVVQTDQPPWWQWAIAGLTCSWVFLLLTALQHSRGETREWGKDRIYELPLRLCPGCRPKLNTRLATLGALRRVPLYADLLDRYPRAEVSLPVP